VNNLESAGERERRYGVVVSLCRHGGKTIHVQPGQTVSVALISTCL
jgi:hypothetical protein